MQVMGIREADGSITVVSQTITPEKRDTKPAGKKVHTATTRNAPTHHSAGGISDYRLADAIVQRMIRNQR